MIHENKSRERERERGGEREREGGRVGGELRIYVST